MEQLVTSLGHRLAVLVEALTGGTGSLTAYIFHALLQAPLENTAFTPINFFFWNYDVSRNNILKFSDNFYLK